VERTLKVLFLLFVAGVAGVIAPVGGLAAVSVTSHDMSVNYPSLDEAGICSPCHLPHGTPGERLFPDPGPGGLSAGVVGQLCAVCHHSGGGYSGALGGSAVSDSYVYHPNSHGHQGQMTVAEHPDADTTYLTASSLPYVSDATPTMECTSCHNVHDDSDRPFLRNDINSLCSMCHNNRHYDGGASAFVQGAAMAAWGLANSRVANPGSHPVGTDVTASFNDSTQTITISAEFDVGFSAVNDGWKIGGHLTAGDTGGVTCVSCHTVHGSQDDADDAGANFGATEHVPYVNFLTVDQASNVVSYTLPGALFRSVASGFGDYNPLCEDCHNGSLGAGYTLNGGDTAVDPGATTFTHPLDGIVPSDDGWVTAFPANWPVGGGFSTGMGPVAICESCHVAHPVANANVLVARDDVSQGATDYAFILRTSQESVCSMCHTGFIDGHHPIGVGAWIYDSSGVAYLNNTTGAPGDELECRSCHADQGAHNWDGVNEVGLDDNWIPLNNGRNLTTPSIDAVNSSLSQTCMDCHFEIDGDASTYSPTLGDGNGSDAAAIGYSVMGAGTHFMGNTIQDSAGLTADLAPQLANVYTTAAQAWPVSIEGASGTGWARFRQLASAGTPAIIACESCHELEPDKNNSRQGGYNLLLANFSDGTNGNSGDSDGRDDFCEACHLPPGTHPMTGDMVDRTGLAIDIVLAKDWLADPTGSEVTWDIANDIMSCDSCHQVHDAETDSANMILEAADADIPPAAGAVVDANNLVPNFPDGNRGPNHEVFCQYCHGY
jgi:predicted CXXCH cytochrome family protein